MASAVGKFRDQLDGLSLGSLDTTAEPKVQKIPLDQISSDPANPRKSFDEEELAALAQSIKERGLLQPITLRKLGPKSYVVRFGDRRFRAAKIAGLETIAAIVTEEKADAFDIVDQVLENDQRVDLTIKEMAAAVKDMTDRGMKQKDLAARLGRDAKTVSRLASVADMPAVLTDLLDTVGLRTVYNLYQVWSTAPEKVDVFLKDTPSDDVTRARVDQLGSVDKGDSQMARALIQGCLWRGGGVGARRSGRRGVGDHWRAASARARAAGAPGTRQSAVPRWNAAHLAHRLPVARYARALRQVEFGLRPLPALGQAGRVGRAVADAGRSWTDR